jgi:hypothetical protein
VAYQIAGLEPTADAGVRAVWTGIRRRQATAPLKVRAVRTKVVATMVAPLGDRLADVRAWVPLLVHPPGAGMGLACRLVNRRRRSEPSTGTGGWCARPRRSQDRLSHVTILPTVR